MRVPLYLVRNPSGLYYFRLRVPADLRSQFGTLIKRATGTRDPQTAVAFALVAAARYAQAFRAARLGTVMPKPPTIADILAGRSGTGGDLRTWTAERLDLPGVSLRNVSVVDDADAARFNRMLKEVYGSVPAAALTAPKPAAAPDDGVARIPMGEAVEKWAATIPCKKPSQEKTRGAKMKAVGGFRDFLEGLPAEQRPEWVRGITRTHCSEWYGSLMKSGKLDARTVENRFIYLIGFFVWAQAGGYYPPGDNPARGHANVRKAEKRKAALARGAERFEKEQLRRIFDPENYGSLASGPNRWLPIIALFSGARGNEIAHLEVRDIYTDDHGVLVFDFNLRGDHKSIKNAASARTTPVHPLLVELGLLDYVSRLRAAGETKLFPTLTFTAQNGPANAPMTAFTRYLAKVGVKARSGTVGTHSFRDTVLNQLKVRGVPEEVREEYTGHAVGNRPEHASAYEDPLSTLNLAKRCHPALDFDLDVAGLRPLLLDDVAISGECA